MDGAAKPNKINDEIRRHHARLTLDHARIRLQYASLVRGKTAAALYAPSLEGNQELLRAAIGAAGLMAEFFDATQFSAVELLMETLPKVDAIIILSDEAFHQSFLSEPHVTWITEQRPSLRPIVVRVGDTEETKRMRFCLARGEAIKILDDETWRLVPDFIIEAARTVPTT